jgi:WD40 repeat protein
MTDPETCSHCGAELAPSGVCTACALDVALRGEDEFCEESPLLEWRDGIPALGQRVGACELLERIARGGMGVVYRARQIESGRVVALKMLLPQQIDSARAVARFGLEVRTASTLDHPNILPVFEVGEVDGLPYFTMKFADGGSLAQQVRDFPGQPRAAAGLVASIARALQHAHERGVLHRDVKPGNILLDGEGRALLGDFGLAKSFLEDVDLTRSIAILGTPAYMAPEQARAGVRDLTVAADIYSLGAVLYELLTGQPPFQGNNALEILQRVQAGSPVPPTALSRATPRDLEIICLKCLAKEPGARYASAAEFADDLERWRAGHTIRARPATSQERLWRWSRRNPALAGMTALVALLLLTVSIVSTVAALRLRESTRRAVAAEHDANIELRASLLEQARNKRLAGRMGQRVESLEALAKAAALRPGEDLRTEAVAALMLVDLRREKSWHDRYASNSPAAFDATFTHYAAETGPGDVELRRCADQSEVRHFPGPDGHPRAIFISGFSSDDSKLAVRYANHCVRVFDVGNGSLLFELRDRPVRALNPLFAYDFGFTPDGRELAVARPEGGVSFHDSVSGVETWRLDCPTIPALISSSPDGSLVAVCGQRSTDVEIYERASGKLVRKLSHPIFVVHGAWRPGAPAQFATACADFGIYVWDVGMEKAPVRLRGHRGVPSFVAWHPGGDLLASASRDFSVRLWDPDRAECMLDAEQVYGEPCLRFSGDGRRLAVGSEATGLSTFALLREDPLRELMRIAPGDHFDTTAGFDVSPDGRFLALTFRLGGLRLLSLPDGKLVSSRVLFPFEEKACLFTPRGDALLVSGKQAGLWKFPIARDTADPLFEQPGIQLDARPHFILQAVGGAPPVAALENEVSGCTIVPLEQPENVLDLPMTTEPENIAISPDASIVVVSDREGGAGGGSDARVWSMPDGKVLRALKVGANNSVRFGTSGKYLFASGADRSAIFQVPAFSILREFPTEDGVSSGWFSPGDEWIALKVDGGVALNRVSDGERLCMFPTAEQIGVLFAPDGGTMFLEFGEHLYAWDLRALRSELRERGLDWADGGPAH